MGKEVEWIEHKFSKFFTTKTGKDMHLVKERIHYKDGSWEPNLKFIEDFERPFWVTKKFHRNHKDKKEYEDYNKLDIFYSKESVLPNEIARRIGLTGYRKNNYRDILKSPYVYGSDIPSTTIMSYMYAKKNDGRVSKYSVATFDIEADVITKEITIVSTHYEDKLVMGVNRRLFRHMKQKLTDGEIKTKIEETYRKHAPDKYKNIKFLIHIGDEVSAIRYVFTFLHKAKPDFLAIWNMAYDIPTIVKRLNEHGIPPESIFCDPDVPDDYKRFNFKEGRSKAKKADGQVINIEIQDRWHVVDVIASFYIIDAMCVYSIVRAGAQKLNAGYGIDNVCREEKVSTKMFIPGTIDPDSVSKPQWHIEMSRDFPIEYCAYNANDNTMMTDLLEKTSDLSFNLPTLADHSSFDYFNSLTRKIADKLFVTLLDDKKQRRVLGNKPYVADKDELLGRDDWIITLESSRIVEEEKDIFMEERKIKKNAISL